MTKFNMGVAEQEATRKRSEGEAEVCVCVCSPSTLHTLATAVYHTPPIFSAVERS